MAHGKKRGSTRGRHKRQRSPETHRWEQEHMVPKCPPWMKRADYEALVKLRNSV